MIARRPKTVDTLDDMIEAIKLLAESGGAEEKDKTIRVTITDTVFLDKENKRLNA